MSDNWIALVPEDPRVVPNAAARRRELVIGLPKSLRRPTKSKSRSRKPLSSLTVGRTLSVSVVHRAAQRFPPIGGKARMDEDSNGEDGFKLAAYAVPCCRKKYTLHELAYDWPQGFGRFALDAMNPNIGELEDKYKREFENPWYEVAGHL